jgi:hypothetical protein
MLRKELLISQKRRLRQELKMLPQRNKRNPKREQVMMDTLKLLKVLLKEALSLNHLRKEEKQLKMLDHPKVQSLQLHQQLQQHQQPQQPNLHQSLQ